MGKGTHAEADAASFLAVTTGVGLGLDGSIASTDVKTIVDTFRAGSVA
jgi:hypothetical protein